MTHKKIKEAVGTLFISSETKRVLLCHRSHMKSFPNHWCLWSGTIEEQESPIFTLLRECKEELGFDVPIETLHPWNVMVNEKNNFTFYTFVSVVKSEFIPILNYENNGYGWFNIASLPRPLHPGVKNDFMGQKNRIRLEKTVNF